MSRTVAAVHGTLLSVAHALRTRLRPGAERGQTTAEYALVLLGVAAVALLILAWAADTNRVSRLMDKVFDAMIGKIT